MEYMNVQEEIENEVISPETESNKAIREYNQAFNETKELKLTPEEEEALLNFEIKQKGDDLIIEKIDPNTTKPTVLEITPPGQDSIIQKTEDIPFTVEQEVTPIDIPSETKEIPPSVVDEKKDSEPEFQIEQLVNKDEVLSEENKAQQLVEQFGEYDPTLDLGSYQFPAFDS